MVNLPAWRSEAVDRMVAGGVLDDETLSNGFRTLINARKSVSRDTCRVRPAEDGTPAAESETAAQADEL